ncbi:hypothetical protein [Litorihabitans aurantiacus]|nr:hypothetical protein [Litorihabitans aurantiacus]
MLVSPQSWLVWPADPDWKDAMVASGRVVIDAESDGGPVVG